VLYIDQHSLHNRLLLKDSDIYIWTADSPKGDKYLAIFNARDDQKPQEVTVNRKLLGIKASTEVTDLWSHKKVSIFGESFSATVPRHGVKLYRLSSA
jgi:alpha-galactosidase